MENLVKIDKIDRKLLFELDCDSRQSISDLSRKVKLGRDLVAYRVRRLESEKLILGYSAAINPFKLGFSLFKAYFKLKNDFARKNELLAELLKNKRVFCIAECDGSWDLVFNTLAKDAYEFHMLQENILSKFNDLILDFSIYLLINKWFYPKKYLVSAKNEKYFLVGGAPVKTEIDQIDLGLLDALVKNARVTVAELANTLDTVPTVINRRILRLEALGIIVAYRIDIDRQKLGLTLFKAQLTHAAYNTDATSRLLEFAVNHPQVNYVIQQVGNCKLELGLEVTGYDQYNQVLTEFRSRFPELVVNVQTVLVRNDIYRWLPSGSIELEIIKEKAA